MLKYKTPNWRATVYMFETYTISSIIFHSNSNDVDTVIINGVILKRDGQLISKDLDTKLETLAASGHRIMHQYREMQAMEKKEG